MRSFASLTPATAQTLLLCLRLESAMAIKLPWSLSSKGSTDECNHCLKRTLTTAGNRKSENYDGGHD